MAKTKEGYFRFAKAGNPILALVKIILSPHALASLNLLCVYQ
jgi:hypothetical protein